VSSESNMAIDFRIYEKQYKESIDAHMQDYRNSRDYEISIKLDVLPKDQVEKMLMYNMENYADAFLFSDLGGYSLFVNKDKRLFIFNTFNKAKSLDEQLKVNKPEILSLLNRFHPRKLYEVPTEQGFCFPYGFIAGDSGHEKRNMGVTYRLKDHPDVSIFFQDLGTSPGPGERRPDEKMSAKDYVTYFWNMRYGHSFREVKLYGKGFSSPKIDNRDGVAALAKFTRRSKEVDYGYMAYVKEDAKNNEPGLLFYVIRDSRQVKGQPPMDKNELEKMAERIVRSIKRR
ncbi:MAG TPA: T6SS immunity protein Tli4 family protein, partial [Buttiauxella sp.]|nr:T6SS immunity protein Tli4 family protein [Buttiauxella sp.]